MHLWNQGLTRSSGRAEFACDQSHSQRQQIKCLANPDQLIQLKGVTDGVHDNPKLTARMKAFSENANAADCSVPSALLRRQVWIRDSFISAQRGPRESRTMELALALADLVAGGCQLRVGLGSIPFGFQGRAHREKRRGCMGEDFAECRVSPRSPRTEPWAVHR